VVRISGPRSDAALHALAGALPEPRTARLATLRHQGEILDRALVIRFPGPSSVTGEDVAELHLHGGRAVVAAILAVLAGFEGLRAAEPGEFTRRAFENGRIDLSEAEGLADLLFSETQVATPRRARARGRRARPPDRGLAGAAAWRCGVGRVPSSISPTKATCRHMAAAPRASCARSARRLGRGSIVRRSSGCAKASGVVIAGPPNAGKSSLLNVLAGRQAGDYLGQRRDHPRPRRGADGDCGTPFLLVDTAGLRDAGDEVEAIGVARAQASLAAADLILWLGDPDECGDRGRAILVHPKADISTRDARAEVAVSAKTGEGIDELVRLLIERTRALLPAEGDVAINARHRAALVDCHGWVTEAQAANDPLIVAEALRQARVALDRVTGRAGVEDMLDALFGRFCIGK
jgi:tRNA modification GTPase